MSTSTVPPDFPRDPFPGALPGAATKFIAHKSDDGRYVVGLSDDELALRHAGCLELVSDMVEYYHRKMREHPEWERGFLIKRIRDGLMSEMFSLDISASEVTWIVNKTTAETGIDAMDATKPAAGTGEDS